MCVCLQEGTACVISSSGRGDSATTNCADRRTDSTRAPLSPNSKQPKHTTTIGRVSANLQRGGDGRSVRFSPYENVPNCGFYCASFSAFDSACLLRATRKSMALARLTQPANLSASEQREIGGANRTAAKLDSSGSCTA